MAAIEKAVARYHPYPDYRDSSVDWLGEIPSHWGISRLRFVCWINPPKSEASRLPSDFEVSFLPMELISDDGSLTLEETQFLEDVRQGYTYFRNGDVIVAKITPCFENGKGALCQELVNGIGFGTTELHVLRPTSADARYIYYLTHSKPFRDIGAGMMYGAAGQQRVPENFVKDFRLGFPPLPEQRAIADFLDQETTRLDALIAAKRRLIELLHEKRQALISHVATRGLDPNVPMRDSGIEWMGEIPSHWEIKRLKHLVYMFGGGTPSKDNGNYWNGNIPWVSPKDMKTEIIEETEDHITEQGLRESAATLVNPGAVLVVVRSGILKHSLPVAINTVPVSLNQDMKALYPMKLVTAAYLAWLLKGFEQHILVICHKLGATVDSIESERLREMNFPIPPLEEQDRIIQYLERENREFADLTNNLHETIERLEEYRTALISAAVTGKIDVRGEFDET